MMLVNRRWPTAGLTLIEVLAGLALTATLIALGASAAGGLLRAVRVAVSAQHLANDLRLARSISLSRNRTVTVECEPGASACLIVPARQAATEHRLTRGVRIIAANSGGVIIFHPSGHAENATVVLGDDSRRRRVRVNQRGRVRVD